MLISPRVSLAPTPDSQCVLQFMIEQLVLRNVFPLNHNPGGLDGVGVGRASLAAGCVLPTCKFWLAVKAYDLSPRQTPTHIWFQDHEGLKGFVF